MCMYLCMYACMHVCTVVHTVPAVNDNGSMIDVTQRVHSLCKSQDWVHLRWSAKVWPRDVVDVRHLTSFASLE